MDKKKMQYVRSTIDFPVKYEPYGTCILDKNNSKVLDVRGWGKISYMDHPEERQDAIGEWIAELINSNK